MERAWWECRCGSARARARWRWRRPRRSRGNCRRRRPELEVEIVKFETVGDSDQTSKLLRHGGKGGAFVEEIRAAVHAGRLHAAMHSLKDMPGNEDTPGLIIGATLTRDPPTDALVLRPGVTLEAMQRSRGKGFKIGTNAVRRAAYARRLFPEIEIIHFRGAADTRIRKLDNQRDAAAARRRRGRPGRCADHGAVGAGARRLREPHRA